MAIDPRRLAYLLAVHRSGGVLAAADMLKVTPSAVSQQIARLEAEEGVQVLDRGPRGVTLTPVGRMLAEAAERIEAELVAAKKQITALDDDIAGPVAIGAFPTVIIGILVPALALLKETHPGIEVEVVEHEEQEAMRALRAGDLDIALHEIDADTEHAPPRGQRDVPLLDEPWRLVTPATMPVPATLHDVADATWIAADPDTAAARAARRMAETFRITMRERHYFYDFGVALSLVAAGEGVALLPALALQHGVPDGVQVVPLPGLGARRIMARHRQTKHEPRPAVSAVLEALAQATSALELG